MKYGESSIKQSKSGVQVGLKCAKSCIFKVGRLIKIVVKAYLKRPARDPAYSEGKWEERRWVRQMAFVGITSGFVVITRR